MNSHATDVPPTYNDLIGEWFYDAQTDESCVVVAPWHMEGELFGVITMYADGVSWGEIIDITQLNIEQIDQLGFDRGGFDPRGHGGRYTHIDMPFPSFSASSELCKTGHTFNVKQGDVFEGEGYAGKLRERHIRCARCALSFAVILNHGLDNPELDHWLDSDNEG